MRSEKDGIGLLAKLELDNKVYKLFIFCGNLFTPKKTNQLIVSSKVFY